MHDALLLRNIHFSCLREHIFSKELNLYALQRIVWKDPPKQKEWIVINSIFDWAHTMFGKVLHLSVECKSNGGKSNSAIFLAIVWTYYKNRLLWVLGSLSFLNDSWNKWLKCPPRKAWYSFEIDEMQVNLVNCSYADVGFGLYKTWVGPAVCVERSFPCSPLSFFFVKVSLSEKFLFR